MASVDVGNYNNRRLEAMLNVPIIGDKLGLRMAGEWTKRDGYSFNETTNKPIDGRNLWSSRVTLGFKPLEQFQVHAIWEHFDEKDDRIRSSKQLCKKDPGPDIVDGFDINSVGWPNMQHAWLSQGCLPTSMYSEDAFQTPNSGAIPFVAFAQYLANGLSGANDGFLLNDIDPYASTVQSRDLRKIQSDRSPTYRAKNDVFQINADLALSPSLTLTSQSAYSRDELRSTQDFNRFNTSPNLFSNAETDEGGGGSHPPVAINGVYCDPQLGCSTKMVGEDLSQQKSWQFSQEIRLASKFEGPFNFSIGANYLHYQTLEDYYVFFNLLTAITQLSNFSGAGDYTNCYEFGQNGRKVEPVPFYLPTAAGVLTGLPSNYGCYYGGPDNPYNQPGTYIDPNPISSLDGQGHNYFRSQNPYHLNSWAGFGEAYYQVAPDLKLTAGLRWTSDSKTFWNYPSWAFLEGGGYPLAGIVKQEWKEWTGRFNATWSPQLDFTDQTLVYASFAHGYKGGGANPPPAQSNGLSSGSFVIHPATFEPEFVNAFELGTKNALLDGALTFNASAFFYDYKGYQISQIVDRTSINLNFDAKVKGLEVEATWEPLPGLRLNFAGGLEDSSVNKGQSAIDLMDRTAGHSDWLVVKPFPTSTSNCILPATVMRNIIEGAPPQYHGQLLVFNPLVIACDVAYNASPNSPWGTVGVDPSVYAGRPSGFDPATAPNGGAGFAKDLSGNKLPNTPPFTLSAGAQYSLPISESWAATLRGDFYWQGNSYARIFNSKPYDQIHGYSTSNLAVILTNQDGWQAMAYVKNVFDKTAITGAFLNSDDTALTTNIFVTDPRLFGIRITKNW
jgi:outer membrane receptor protein involved in Fe transport